MTKPRSAEQIQAEYDSIIQQANKQPGISEAIALFERAEQIETGIVATYFYGMTVAGSTNSHARTHQ